MCETGGEEILNEREVVAEGLTLCQGCAGQTYYAMALPLAEPLARTVRSAGVGACR